MTETMIMVVSMFLILSTGLSMKGIWMLSAVLWGHIGKARIHLNRAGELSLALVLQELCGIAGRT